MSTTEAIREILVSLSDEEREKVARYVEALSEQPRLAVEGGKDRQKNIQENRNFQTKSNFDI
jgi:2-C-methyl-D-erythritol 4-phosphate cytidylyltransferase